MRAMQYSDAQAGGDIELVDLAMPDPAPGEVRVRIAVSGVNPTDWKTRVGGVDEPKVPNQDGAGVVDALGEGVTDLAPGQRVWVWEAAYQRTRGTAEEYVTLPAHQVTPLPDDASFEVGASLGIPAITAHRALTSFAGAPDRLAPGALAEVAVLVTGGAGAVGHAAIQLASWAGATVVATVSSPEKAELARAAGAHHVLDYRRDDVAARVREIVPDGVRVVVDVDVVANLEADLDALAVGGTIAVYASKDHPGGGAGGTLEVPIRRGMQLNARFELLLVYTSTIEQKTDAVAAIQDALADDALGVGEERGLPLVRFPLERMADAHRAVRDGAVGKVLIDVADLG